MNRKEKILRQLKLDDRSIEYSLELKNDLSDLHLFIGAGLSCRPPASLPSWNKLFDLMKTDMKVNVPKSGDLLKDFTYLYQSKRKKFFTVLEDKINRDNISVPKAHKLIIQLPTKKKIFTTNIDTLIEQAFYSKKVAFSKIISDKDHVFVRQNSRPVIVKLHGCIHFKSSIIFTRDEYFEVTKQKEKLLSLFESILSDSQFFFLGYNFNYADQHILQILRNNKKYNKSDHSYAIGFNTETIEVDDFKENYNIKTIVLKKYEDLDIFLLYLLNLNKNQLIDHSHKNGAEVNVSMFENEILNLFKSIPIITINDLTKKYDILEDTAKSLLEILCIKGFVIEIDSNRFRLKEK